MYLSIQEIQDRFRNSISEYTDPSSDDLQEASIGENSIQEVEIFGKGLFGFCLLLAG